MKAYSVSQWLTDVNQLVPTTIPDPKCPPTGLVCEIRAIGLNFFDILLVKGQYQMKPKFPFVPGAEFAGIVTEVGPNVQGFRVGDKVFGTDSVGLNAYAEKVAVDVKKSAIFKIPEGLSFSEAACVPMIYPTSWIALAHRAQLRAGEICLIHAAAGGVGIAAVQIAKSLGAIVIATAGSDAKLALCKSAGGADYVINYTTEKNWAAKVNEIAKGIPKPPHAGGGPRVGAWVGADVIYDPVGLINESTKCVAWNGRILVVGFAGGKIENVPANRLLLKGASLVGVFWGATTLNEQERVPETWKGVFNLFSQRNPGSKDNSVFKPLIFTDDQYVGLESIPKALVDLASRKTYGKVIVELPPGKGLSKL